MEKSNEMEWKIIQERTSEGKFPQMCYIYLLYDTAVLG